ncbi:MAG: c-type cytochrome [Acidobacteria bacterium]|nr:c-type cytochrome [Acidobacteriota bacterium]MBV9474610.1 c-type cytochrome [Acidobacteriota bacterium]
MRRATITLIAATLLCATGAAPQEDPDIAAILKQIKGKEDRPASEVFHNVKLLQDLSATRLLRTMDGFNRALGTSCDYCHVDDRWEADDKRPKRAAREMLVMTRGINEQLGKMTEIDESEASVQCVTCHRAHVKPAEGIR